MHLGHHQKTQKTSSSPPSDVPTPVDSGGVVSSQVYLNLQPLNVCMSYQRTLNLISKVSDIEVRLWSDEKLQPPQTVSFSCTFCTYT